MMSRFFRAALVVFGVPLALTACNGPNAVNCPGAAILADIATRQDISLSYL